MLSSVSVWGLLLSYTCQGYAAYVFFNWFFIYLVRVRGLTLTAGSFWSSTPFIATTLFAPTGGWVCDRAVRRFGKRRGRQTTGWLGMGCSAMLLWAGSHTVDYRLAILLLAAAAGFNFFAMPSWWATCIDLTPNYSGSLSGLMNTCGNLAGWISPILTAFIATHFGWTQALDFAALVTAASGLLWFLVDANKTLEE
jgi:ACS family glucarate transporter-like MFS transporter